jgi:hypothetical protein
LESGPHAQSAMQQAQRVVARKFFMVSNVRIRNRKVKSCTGDSIPCSKVKASQRKPRRRNYGRQGGGEKDDHDTHARMRVRTFDCVWETAQLPHAQLSAIHGA